MRQLLTKITVPCIAFILFSCAEDTIEYGTFQVEELDTEVITSWNDLWLQLDRYALGMRPSATSRALAYIHLAGYETAVPFMSTRASLSALFDGLQIDESQRTVVVDPNLALNACYALVFDHFMRNISNDAVLAQKDALNERLLSTYSNGKPEAHVAESIRWGEYVANTIIAYSRTDLNAEEQILEPQPLSYEPPTGAGFWTYSAEEERALFPYWGSVRTFLISPEETTTVAPLEYSTATDSEYYMQMLEVYNRNNQAKQDNNEELWIAEFWSDDVQGLMLSPPGRQLSIANQLIIENEMSAYPALELLLKLGFSLNDAAVSAWYYKYLYMTMRPSEYIKQNIDPEYQTNLFRLVFWPNPTFPSYPSGHSTFASAAAGVFIDAFGDDILFTDRTHEGRTEFLGKPRTFTSFTQMAKENAHSRMPLGVHVLMDCDEGLRLGYEIADKVVELDLSGTSN